MNDVQAHAAKPTTLRERVDAMQNHTWIAERRHFSAELRLHDIRRAVRSVGPN